MALKEVGWSKRCLQEFATNNKGSHGRVPAVLLSRRVQKTAGKPRCGQRRGQDVLLTSDIFRCLKRSSWKRDENPSFIIYPHLSLFVDVLPKKPSWIGVPWPLSWAEAKWWRIGTEMLEAKGGSVPCALSKPPPKNRSQSGTLENIICWCWV